jgi:hypothetical protein
VDGDAEMAIRSGAPTMDKPTNDAILSDEVWKHHANRWSVITRYSAFPFIIASIWSRLWLGWWYMVPLAIAAAWIWINPWLFRVPASTSNWASKAVLGERVWLNRKTIPIPEHHARAAIVLNVVTGLGALVLCYGLYALDPWCTALGISITFFGRAWFLDRMVWLFEDMIHTSAEYRDWLY